MKFSVLMSVYLKDDPDHLNIAIQSIFTSQILKPNQIVIVCDGPITDKQSVILEFWKSEYPDIFDIISYSINSGLSFALNHGIKFCKYDYVARMDSDDISYPNRFSLQITYLKLNPDIDILGSYISEFDFDHNLIKNIRKVPLKSIEILNFSKYRCPLNHMTVVYKRAIFKNNNYIDLYTFDDYYLWVRLLIQKYKIINLPNILVNARVGNGMISNRRHGFKFFYYDFKLQALFFSLKHINFFQFVFNIFLRCFPRILPVFFLEHIYSKFLRSNSFE